METTNENLCCEFSPPEVQLCEMGVYLENPGDYGVLLARVAEAARTCYKSTALPGPGESYLEANERFVAGLIKKGHESVIEHGNITVCFLIDRGTSHELVRHRLAAVSQESTRYCNYKKDRVTFVCPETPEDPIPEERLKLHHAAYKQAEQKYMELLEAGAAPQEARQVLPNALLTTVVMTANFREWRHILKLRTSPAASPMIRHVMKKLLKVLQKEYPVFFKDIQPDTQ